MTAFFVHWTLTNEADTMVRYISLKNMCVCVCRERERERKRERERERENAKIDR